MSNFFKVEPDTLDLTVKNIVESIDKGNKLIEKKVDDVLTDEERLDFSDCIILQPDYQREYRSGIEDESSLIESILVGIPIPPVFLSSTRYKGAQVLDVVDGQHRLKAFYRFRKGEFALKNLPLLKDFEGNKFSELPIEQQEVVVAQKIPAYVFRNFPGKEFELEVFNRYNKGTKSLTAQEIRNAVYGSCYNDYITDFVADMHTKKESPLRDVYNVTTDRYLKKKIHEGIFSILYILEKGINKSFKDSTTYANEFMKIKSNYQSKNSDEDVNADLELIIQRFNDFNQWILKFKKYTPYPFSKELYGISSKSYKFQTSMAMILAAIYRKVYILKEVSFKNDSEEYYNIKKSLLNSFLEDVNYNASSTNSIEIEKFINMFGTSIQRVLF